MIPSIETFSGCFVNFVKPCETQVNLRDIAYGLSRQSRFNGHTKGCVPYSVAQHSVWVAMIAQKFFDADQHTTLLALFHDAHEAYTGDIVSPLKYMPDIHEAVKAVEERLQKTIHCAFGLCDPDSKQHLLIELVDRKALLVEGWHLMPSRAEGWSNNERISQQTMETFRPALESQKAFELFWCAEAFIRSGLDLEELWLST